MLHAWTHFLPSIVGLPGISAILVIIAVECKLGVDRIQ
jgi:hypothetical protein